MCKVLRGKKYQSFNNIKKTELKAVNFTGRINIIF